MAQIELNQGEVKLKFDDSIKGKKSLAELGLKNENLKFEGGLVRLVFDFENVKDKNYYAVPTLEVGYTENMEKTHWQCDFNRETILDKIDNHGHSTMLLLDRKKMSSLEQHHENELVIHAEFPKGVQIDPEKSFVNLFQ